MIIRHVINLINPELLGVLFIIELARNERGARGNETSTARSSNLPHAWIFFCLPSSSGREVMCSPHVGTRILEPLVTPVLLVSH